MTKKKNATHQKEERESISQNEIKRTLSIMMGEIQQKEVDKKLQKKHYYTNGVHRTRNVFFYLLLIPLAIISIALGVVAFDELKGSKTIEQRYTRPYKDIGNDYKRKFPHLETYKGTSAQVGEKFVKTNQRIIENGAETADGIELYRYESEKVNRNILLRIIGAFITFLLIASIGVVLISIVLTVVENIIIFFINAP